uniref:Neuronal PAS domain-containing protein 4 n=1 Tax=Panagrellus redivivus TaxID=6233 RepID=A0A7E4VJM6_PANRE
MCDFFADSSMNLAYSPNLPARSTRGASKQRRDQINIEIQKLRDLLPLSGSIKDRLFQLQVMSLACIFIRKQQYFPYVAQTCEKPIFPMFHRHLPLPKQFDGCKALRGFLLMATRAGKLLYISENASEYLGYSVEEIMCQGDSIYDLVDSRDHAAVQAEFCSGPPSATSGTFPDDRVFICRMNLSRTAKRHIQYYKFILVEGRYLHPIEYYQALNAVPNLNSTAPIQPIFAAFCRPLINPENAETLATGNTAIFRSVHSMDFKFAQLDDIGSYYLGFTPTDVEGVSLYKMLHPMSVDVAASKHRILCQQKEGSAIALLRLQTRSGSFVWLHSVFIVKTTVITPPPPTAEAPATVKVEPTRRFRHHIHATYQVLTDLEAATLQTNDWIYAIKQHHFTRELSKDEYGEAASPESSESEYSSSMNDYVENAIPNGETGQTAAAICVEIPTKVTPEASFSSLQHSATTLPTDTEHSSPSDSSSSLSRTYGIDVFDGSVPHLSTTNMNYYAPVGVTEMPLPELGDDLDEFFRHVEFSPPIEQKVVPSEVMPAQTVHPARGIKREWWEAGLQDNSAIDYGHPHSVNAQPTVHTTPTMHHTYRQQRHHSIQFGGCEPSTFQMQHQQPHFNTSGHASEVSSGYMVHDLPGHHRQKRLGSWAGMNFT